MHIYTKHIDFSDRLKIEILTNKCYDAKMSKESGSIPLKLEQESDTLLHEINGHEINEGLDQQTIKEGRLLIHVVNEHVNLVIANLEKTHKLI